MLVDPVSDPSSEGDAEMCGVGGGDEYTDGDARPEPGRTPSSNQFMPRPRPSPRSNAASSPKSISNTVSNSSICSVVNVVLFGVSTAALISNVAA